MPPKKPAKPRVPKTRGSGTYTEAGFFGFIRSGLRAKYSRWKPRYNVLNAAKVKYVGPNPRQKFAYLCSICNNTFPQKEVEVDHIVECGSLRSFNDLPGFCERLFCEEDGLRVVCKPCHQEITNAARAARRESDEDHPSST